MKKRIAGVDEVGRGPLAGPVVAAAVVFYKGYKNADIRDSKKLTAKAREELVDVIKEDAVQWAIVSVGHHRIARWNIREASKWAMSLALRRVTADMVLVDGNMAIYTPLQQKTVVGGDDKHVEISAASILAKVWRDKIMNILDLRHPGYGFAQHKGYATAEHRAALNKLKPCPVHRMSFHGVFDTLQQSLFPLEEEDDLLDPQTVDPGETVLVETHP
jgi:ribonuclease HII